MYQATKKTYNQITEKPQAFVVFRDGEPRRMFFTQELAEHSADFMGTLSSGGDRHVIPFDIPVEFDPSRSVYHLADGEASLADRRKHGGDSELSHDEALAKLRERMKPGYEIEVIRRWDGFETHFLKSRTGTVHGATALYYDGSVMLPYDRLEAKHWCQDDMR